MVFDPNMVFSEHDEFSETDNSKNKGRFSRPQQFLVGLFGFRLIYTSAQTPPG